MRNWVFATNSDFQNEQIICKYFFSKPYNWNWKWNKTKIYFVTEKSIDSGSVPEESKTKIPVLYLKGRLWKFRKSQKRNWVFGTNANFLISISLQSDGVHIWYFKLRLFNITASVVWNNKSIRHRVEKI